MLRRVLLVLLLFVGCTPRAKVVSLGVYNDKKLDRLGVGREERYEVSCVEGEGEEVYVWVKVGKSSSAFDSEKRVWDFVGLRKRDGKVLRVINSSCRMVMEVLI